MDYCEYTRAIALNQVDLGRLFAQFVLEGVDLQHHVLREATQVKVLVRSRCLARATLWGCRR